MASETKVLEEVVVPGKRLGRHVEHDPRSKNHPFGILVEPRSWRTIHHRHVGNALDQGNLGSCTGNATAQALNTRPLYKVGFPVLYEVNAVKIYSLATKLDEFDGEYPPTDTGSSGLAAAKAAKQLGLIRKYKHAFSIEEALAALQIRPIITGIDWYEGFDQPNDDGIVKIEGQVRGGHEFVLTGFEYKHDIDSSLVVALNSWGKDYGMNGLFKFTVADYRILLATQGDATVLM